MREERTPSVSVLSGPGPPREQRQNPGRPRTVPSPEPRPPPRLTARALPSAAPPGAPCSHPRPLRGVSREASSRGPAVAAAGTECLVGGAGCSASPGPPPAGPSGTWQWPRPARVRPLAPQIRAGSPRTDGAMAAVTDPRDRDGPRPVVAVPGRQPARRGGPTAASWRHLRSGLRRLPGAAPGPTGLRSPGASPPGMSSHRARPSGVRAPTRTGQRQGKAPGFHRVWVRELGRSPQSRAVNAPCCGPPTIATGRDCCRILQRETEAQPTTRKWGSPGWDFDLGACGIEAAEAGRPPPGALTMLVSGPVPPAPSRKLCRPRPSSEPPTRTAHLSSGTTPTYFSIPGVLEKSHQKKRHLGLTAHLGPGTPTPMQAPSVWPGLCWSGCLSRLRSFRCSPLHPSPCTEHVLHRWQQWAPLECVLWARPRAPIL